MAAVHAMTGAWATAFKPTAVNWVILLKNPSSMKRGVHPGSCVGDIKYRAAPLFFYQLFCRKETASSIDVFSPACS